METSNANSDRTSNDLVWKIVVSIRWDENISSIVFNLDYKLFTQFQYFYGLFKIRLFIIKYSSLFLKQELLYSQ